jgi:hypothetical protein
MIPSPLIGKHFVHAMYFVILAALIDIPSRWSLHTICPLTIGVMLIGNRSIFLATYLVRGVVRSRRPASVSLPQSDHKFRVFLTG